VSIPPSLIAEAVPNLDTRSFRRTKGVPIIITSPKHLIIFSRKRGESSMKLQSLITKRSIVVAGRKTSVSLEDAFWEALREIARGREKSLSELVGSIDADRNFSNLSSAIRLFVIGFYQDQLSQRA
jgi:predicted DNA-binding ribbon-helix-helix protein